MGGRLGCDWLLACIFLVKLGSQFCADLIDLIVILVAMVVGAVLQG